MKLRKGMKVRFTVAELGASERDELYGCVSVKPAVGDAGTVSFPHPNPKLRPAWWYVEWQAPDGRKLYVGITANHVEEVTS